MCNLKDGFKLCTCKDGQKPQTHYTWELKRRNPALEQYYLKGDAMFPFYEAEEKTIRQKILTALNNRNCFDFDYQPQKDDWLNISNPKLPTGYFEFRYQNKQWEIDTSDDLAAWKTQLEPLQKGKLR